MPMNARNVGYGSTFLNIFVRKCSFLVNVRNSMGMDGMDGRHYANPVMQKQTPQPAYMKVENRENDNANVYCCKYHVVIG